MNQPFQQHPGFRDEVLREQQEQQHQTGGAGFDRLKATQMAGIAVGEAYEPITTNGQVEVAQPGTPEFFRASTVMDRVNSSRARLLRAHQDVERIA